MCRTYWINDTADKTKRRYKRTCCSSTRYRSQNNDRFSRTSEIGHICSQQTHSMGSKYTRMRFSRVLAPPLRRANLLSPDPLAGFEGPPGGGEREREIEEKEGKWKEKGTEGVKKHPRNKCLCTSSLNGELCNFVSFLLLWRLTAAELQRLALINHDQVAYLLTGRRSGCVKCDVTSSHVPVQYFRLVESPALPGDKSINLRRAASTSRTLLLVGALLD